MAKTESFYRKANVSRATATAALFERFPTADLVSFVKKAASADEAGAANAQEGDLVYVATIRLAEFPPSDDSGSEDSAPEAPKEEAPAESKEESPSEDAPSEDGPPAPGGDEGGEGGKPKELSGEDLTNHLLQELLDAVKGGGSLGPDAGADAGPGGPGLDLPDVGAPDQGEGLGGPPAGGAPLPPPVPPKAPMGAGAFAHVVGKPQIHMVREDSTSVGNKAIIAEAAEHAPTHMVARIQRTGSAKIDGRVVDLAASKIAVVTLIAK